MIYEMRTYQLAFGKLAEYPDVAKTRILPSVAEYGLKPSAFSHTEVGQQNEVVHLWSYKDFNGRQEKWTCWAKDPRCVELAKRLRGVILSKTNEILSPTEFSAMQ